MAYQFCKAAALFAIALALFFGAILIISANPLFVAGVVFVLAVIFVLMTERRR